MTNFASKKKKKKNNNNSFTCPGKVRERERKRGNKIANFFTDLLKCPLPSHPNFEWTEIYMGKRILQRGGEWGKGGLS